MSSLIQSIHVYLLSAYYGTEYWSNLVAWTVSSNKMGKKQNLWIPVFPLSFIWILSIENNFYSFLITKISWLFLRMCSNIRKITDQKARIAAVWPHSRSLLLIKIYRGLHFKKMLHLNYLNKKTIHQGVYVNIGSPMAFLKKYVNPLLDP